MREWILTMNTYSTLYTVKSAYFLQCAVLKRLALHMHAKLKQRLDPEFIKHEGHLNLQY